MFLFTTPVSPAKEAASAPAATPVLAAIRDGAKASGTDFDYLVRTAQRESALDPNAKARTSSATGLFQFIEQTWLQMVKEEGGKHGLADYAKAVTATSDGRAQVSDPAMKREILALRNDPKVATALAGELTQRNRDHLRGQLGRAPGDGELYIAHVLGAQGASDLIRTAQANPTSPAATLFPDAASANRSLFFDKAGRARGAGELYALLSGGYTNQAPLMTADRSVAAQPVIRSDGSPMLNLFRTDQPSGPVSGAVAKLWNPGVASDSGDPSLRYFPRSNETGTQASVTASGAPAPDSLAGLRAADHPAPPRRPEASQQIATGGAPTPSVSSSRPLDLSRFMTWRKT